MQWHFRMKAERAHPSRAGLTAARVQLGRFERLHREHCACAIANDLFRRRSEDHQIDRVPPSNANDNEIDVPLTNETQGLRQPAFHSRRPIPARNVRALQAVRSAFMTELNAVA